MLTIQQLDAYKPWLISVARKGSSILPWISNPRDTDYVFYVTDNTCTDRLVEVHKLQPKNECWLFDTLNNCHARVYSYQDHFLIPVYGSEFPKFDILQNKDQYKQRLVSFGLSDEFTPNYKNWYHVLTGIYMLQNDSYELSEEQAENVQLCHDKRMTPELFEWIQEQLQQFKIDIENK